MGGEKNSLRTNGIDSLLVNAKSKTQSADSNLRPRCEGSGKIKDLPTSAPRVEARNGNRNPPRGGRGVWVVTSHYGALNLLQREIPKASVKMATVQQKERLWFHESKSILTVQRRFRLECRNCLSPSKNSIRRWTEHLKSESLHHSFNNFV
ncbi:hypothetical protein AVEN_7875-1 [Araneus ventricosus]|uniref:DUF4817 domain-containing protein n=1 Tax=Araneus ventricosus TaxID=182803 RepID=A0A4Y2JT52_ARAVE|nr:hypothetical protein AVEN_7875-1 [Araneus ventricosus]